jgi:hypothetical protein
VNFETHLNKIQNIVGKEKASERIYLSIYTHTHTHFVPMGRCTSNSGVIGVIFGEPKRLKNTSESGEGTWW